MNEPHPNDLVEFAQYPDTTQRMTYPPLPKRGGDPNAIASEPVIVSMLARRQADRIRKGLEDDMVKLSSPVVPEELSNDPEVTRLQAAGWL